MPDPLDRPGPNANGYFTQVAKYTPKQFYEAQVRLWAGRAAATVAATVAAPVAKATTSAHRTLEFQS